MSKTNEQSIRSERDVNFLEFWVRRSYSGMFYHRIYRNLHPSSPYYVPKAVKLIEKFLDGKQAKVFEWGSGLSTVWYAKRVKSLIAIEHDEKWYRKENSWLRKNKLQNVILKYIPPEENNFFGYEQSILEYDDESFCAGSAQNGILAPML